MNQPKKRNLPDWMLVKPDESSRDDKPVDGKAEFDVIKHIEDSLPVLEFTKSPVYSYNKDDCSLLCCDLLETLEKESSLSYVGFDIEWPVLYRKGEENKTAVLQLCFSPKSCFVFQLSSMPDFPEMLKQLLFCKQLMLVGVGIVNDLWKLTRYFDINFSPLMSGHVLDLGEFANKVLVTSQVWSLDNLTKHLLRHRLNKDPAVRKGDWRKCPLSDTQLLYASTDAFACLQVYHQLLERQKQKL